MDVVRIKYALVSVSQKLGLVSFAHGLREAGVQIYSTGGTRRVLEEAGIETIEVAEYTGFPEMLEGRVKTLHPKVHGGILARRELPEHMQALAVHEIRPFNLIVVNLYPFEQTVARGDCTLAQAVEQIDIGGPAMIRAAAKNHVAVTVVTDAEQYADVLTELRERRGICRETRLRLAQQAFRLTAQYDRAIAEYFSNQQAPEEFPVHMMLQLRRKQVLRYGENPHQKAALYVDPGSSAPDVANARQLHGKALSYNNLLDLDSALQLTGEFSDPAAVVIKHNNPCGAAVAETLQEAFLRAYSGDPVSAFGCVLGFNQPVDEATAEVITEPGRFVEAIIAPSYSREAIKVLTTRPTWKANVRLVEVGPMEQPNACPYAWDLRRITGGVLVQSRDSDPDPLDQWRVMSKRHPTSKELEDLAFAWKVVKHVRSNAIVLAKDGLVVGVGAGQGSRAEAVEIAARKAGDRAWGAVLASDAFFPFRDSPDWAAQAGVTAIVQPGGSRRDDESIDACNEHKMAMVFTGRRHFRH